jgi:hypothetical protein
MKLCLVRSRTPRGINLTRSVKQMWDADAADLLQIISDHQGEWTRKELQDFFFDAVTEEPDSDSDEASEGEKPE